MTCTCSHIKIGSEVTKLRNWNPDCEEHGVSSEWYNSEEQKIKRDKQNLRLRELYAARKLAREEKRMK